MRAHVLWSVHGFNDCQNMTFFSSQKLQHIQYLQDNYLGPVQIQNKNNSAITGKSIEFTFLFSVTFHSCYKYFWCNILTARFWRCRPIQKNLYYNKNMCLAVRKDAMKPVLTDWLTVTDWLTDWLTVTDTNDAFRARPSYVAHSNIVEFQLACMRASVVKVDAMKPVLSCRLPADVIVSTNSFK